MLEMQTTPIIPNAVYAPMILIQTAIVQGKLVTTAQITYAAAKCENLDTEKEHWAATGQSGTVYLGDIAKLEPDLQDIEPVVGEVYARVMKVIAVVNETRKVV